MAELNISNFLISHGWVNNNQPITSATEGGQSVWIDIEFENVSAGDNFYWEISGDGITKEDFGFPYARIQSLHDGRGVSHDLASSLEITDP